MASTIAGANQIEPDAVVKQLAGTTATGRLSRPDEVADLVVLLPSDRADFVIDGGLIATL